MYIDNEELSLSQFDVESNSGLLSHENSSRNVTIDNISDSIPLNFEIATRDTSADNTPGFAPISPETPSWGPPEDNTPGFAPISPETPSWGPPVGNIGVPPIFIIPIQPVYPSNPNVRSANIRFLHAAPRQPAVNIHLGNRTVVNSIQFGNSTSYYLDTGNRRTLITITNSRTGTTLYRGYFNFANETAYTVSIVEDNSRIALYSLVDTPCNSSNAGCLRAVNLSPNSGAVDIFLSGYGRIFRRVNQLSYTGYRSISRGVYRASVSEALPCTSNSSIKMAEGYVECNNTRIAIMDTSTFDIMDGVTYTLYIIGLAYQFPSLRILPLESDLIY